MSTYGAHEEGEGNGLLGARHGVVRLFHEKGELEVAGCDGWLVNWVIGKSRFGRVL